RRHGQVLRLRRPPAPRPDREGLPQGLPQALHRPVADAGGPRRPPALPRGSLPGAVRPVRRLPRDRPAELLPALPAVGGGPGPGVGGPAVHAADDGAVPDAGPPDRHGPQPAGPHEALLPPDAPAGAAEGELPDPPA